MCVMPQTKAISSSLIRRSDLLAVLPMGFGKSLIFHLPICVKQVLSSKAVCVIVLGLLKSIMQDQLKKTSLMGLMATFLASGS